MTTTDHLIGRIVQFGPSIVDIESYPEPGMRARIKAAVYADDCYKITFDFTEFEPWNLPLEPASYYDKDGQPTQTAREAGYYKPVDYFFFGEPEEWPGQFEFLEDAPGVEKILAEYFREREKGQTYTMWLEGKLLALTKQ